MFLLGFSLRLVALMLSLPFLAALFLCDIARVLAEVVLLGTRAEAKTTFRMWSGRWVDYVMGLRS